MSTDALRTAGLLALVGLASGAAVGRAAAQVCARPQPDRISCGYLNPGREAMAVRAVAHLRHLRGPAAGAVVLKLDGRTCSVVAAHWQLGTGDAEALCVQNGGYERHRADAQLYGVRGATPVSFDIRVQPYAGGLERLPRDADLMARPSTRRGLARLWPF